MKSNPLRLLLVAASIALTSALNAVTHNVSNATEFNALPTLNAGDVVVMASGTYGALDKNLVSSITSDAIAQSNPIYIYAAVNGGVDVNQPSQIILDGKGIILAGIDFVAGSGIKDNGTTSATRLILFDTHSAYMTLSNVRFLDCVSGDDYGHWLEVRGFNHTIEYCTFEGKDDPVANATVAFKRNTSEAGIATTRNHVLRRCYFGPRECNLSDNGYESIRIGDSSSQAHDMNVTIEENVFYRAIWRTDGQKPNEPEIISNKTKGNKILNNTFLESFGQITLRHGDACVVDGNYIFGGGYYDSATSIALNAANDHQSGIRVIGEDHIVRNNYMVNLNGSGFRAAITVMAGDNTWDDGNGSGGLNGYEPANNAQVYNNTMIDCKEFSLGEVGGDGLQPTGVQVYNNVWQGSGSDNGIVRESGFSLGGSGGNYVYHLSGDYGWTGLSGTYSSSASPDITESFDQYLIPTSSSPLLGNASATLVASADVRGLSRPGSGQDIGCFEREVSGSGIKPLLRNEVGPEFDGGPAGTYPVIGNTTPSIATSSLPIGTVGVAYLENLVVTGGTAPYTWSLTVGSLPDGISLASDGTLSGTPTTVGASTFTVKVVDDDSEEDTQELTLTIDPVSVSPAKFVIGNSDVTASSYDLGLPALPANAVDGSLDPNSRWAGDGDGEWIRFDLGEVKNVQYLEIAFYKGDERTTNFDIEVSNNDSTWTTLVSNIDSSGLTLALETHDIPDTQARYVRIVGHGNSGGSNWNSLTEVEIWGTSIAAAPAAPGSLTATAGDGEVSLSWPTSSGATSYNVKRSTSMGSGYTLLSSPTVLSYIDSTAVNGTTYYYVVSASNATGESANSSEDSATPIAVPATPADLAATAGDGEVSLTWTVSAGATQHHLKRSTSSGGPYTTAVASVAGGSYTDTTAVFNGTTYYYVVSAENGSGESADSSQVSSKPFAPITPEELVGHEISFSGDDVDVTFQSVAGRVYQLQRSDALDPVDWINVGSPAIGTGAEIILQDATAALIPKRFYRLVIEP